MSGAPDFGHFGTVVLREKIHRNMKFFLFLLNNLLFALKMDRTMDVWMMWKDRVEEVNEMKKKK